ncbi:hypothetical protein LSH36_34g03061 [Paralvinella palmiformis]|uniref:Uncharacterized protein n=1 Tax=Paralvinella palmiformis TaxID=53620 RepID=A0AAD9K8V1_9ANNE|nr:hypothetical protein LSH36_34g03061 [Paralvinella palmiformis]
MSGASTDDYEVLLGDNISNIPVPHPSNVIVDFERTVLFGAVLLRVSSIRSYNGRWRMASNKLLMSVSMNLLEEDKAIDVI